MVIFFQGHARGRRLALAGICWALCGLLSAAVVTLEDAQTAAAAWVRRGGALGALRADAVSGARTYATTNGAAFHLVSFARGGFVVTSADTRQEPVVAFSSAGTPRFAPGSPLWALLQGDFAARGAATGAVTRVALGAAAASAPTAHETRWAQLLGASARTVLGAAQQQTALSDMRVPPLVQSQWGQGYTGYSSPYNYYVPETNVCGCVATALAQLMRYHRHPSASVTPVTRTCAVEGVQKNYTLFGGLYDWDNMPFVPDLDAEDAVYEAIGKLTYDIGVAMQTDWSTDGSSAGAAAAVGPLTNVFSYANARVTTYQSGIADESYRQRVILANLDAECPVFLGLTGNDGGHAILADGYGYVDTTCYTHLNLGWDGEDDLWYALPTVDTPQGTFTTLLSAVYNIFPTQTGEILSGRVLDDAGNPVVGATVTAAAEGSATTLASARTSAYGVYAFVLPGSAAYRVTASWNSAAATRTATLGASESSYVELIVGSCYYAPKTAVACGNAWGQDITLSGVETVATPVFAPAACNVYPSTNVTITCATPGAVLRYTLDGTDPTATSAVYAEPICVDDDMTLTVRAYKTGLNPSPAVSATYVYTVPAGQPLKGDAFADPLRIRGANGSRTIDDNTGYTLETDEPKHSLEERSYYPQWRSVWYEWTAPGSGTITFSPSCQDDYYSYGTIIAVYTNSWDKSCRLGYSTTSTQTYLCEIALDVQQGVSYRIVVAMQGESYCGALTLAWSGDLTVASEATETAGTEVPVAYSWLDAYFPGCGSDDASYAALANGTGANGRPVWESYLLGLDPTNAASAFTASIMLTDAGAQVVWNPTNLNAGALGYAYVVRGVTNLADGVWLTQRPGQRFFKVSVEKR